MLLESALVTDLTPTQMLFRQPALAVAPRRLTACLLLAVLLPGFCFGAVPPGRRPAPPRPQTPPAQSQPAPSPQQGEEEVVRITTNLVQVDAVVLDSNGRPVTDLRPDEVQIYEDGRPRKSQTSRTSPTPADAPPRRRRPRRTGSHRRRSGYAQRTCGGQSRWWLTTSAFRSRPSTPRGAR